MITVNMKAQIELSMKLKNYIKPDVPNIKALFEEELLKTLKEAIGEDIITNEQELTSNISITQLEVKEEKEERGN